MESNPNLRKNLNGECLRRLSTFLKKGAQNSKNILQLFVGF